MTNSKVIRWTGIFGLIGGLLLVLEIPLWIIPGDPGQISDAIAHADYLGNIRIIALTRILIDMFMYVSWLILFAGLRHLIIITQKEFEWIATLSLAAGIVWWTVSLIADGLEGGAILLTLDGNETAAAIKGLVYGTLLIYNGSIAFAVTGFYMGTAGYAILSTRILPRWIGWLSWISVIMCIIAIPAMYSRIVDSKGFYNAAGWGPAVVANIPPLIWIFAVSISMIQKSKKL